MTRLTISLALAMICAACSADETPITPPAPPDDQVCEPAPEEATTVDSLMWKGVDALLNDLGRALELQRDEVCNEMGAVPCSELHRIPLGGSDPFNIALYEPVDVPQANTPLVVERVVLAACANRVALDSEATTSAAVFTHIDLGAAELAADSPDVAAQVGELYQRLLGRAPSESEISTVADLAAPIAGQSVPARDFAVTACFAIATTTDFLFI